KSAQLERAYFDSLEVNEQVNEQTFVRVFVAHRLAFCVGKNCPSKNERSIQRYRFCQLLGLSKSGRRNHNNRRQKCQNKKRSNGCKRIKEKGRPHQLRQANL